jgi:mannose-1-phosphate guanylyltransferase
MLPDLPPENVLGEPRPASTGPALAWGTWAVQQRDPDATILSTHADWWVGDAGAFRDAAKTALESAARHDRLITVGIVPMRPDVSYGYIVPGEPLDTHVRIVQRFQEKPRAEEADRLIRSGALWNSGLFAWTVTRFFAETQAHAPEIAKGLPALEESVAGFFETVTPIAIDVSHFERSQRVGVVAGNFPWDDVGKWSALARVRPVDDEGNVLVGDAHQHDASGCVVWSDGDPIVIDGVEDLVVVRANGVTLVTSRERASHLKTLIEALPDRLRNPGSSRSS